jgi:putative ABC transport system permease protein
MFSLVRSLTLRYLIQKWDRSLLVAISIALGVTMLVSSRLLNQCTEAAAKDTTIPVDTADIYVTSGEHGVDWSIADELRKAQIPGVNRVNRFVHFRVGLPKLNDRTAVVFGIDISAATAVILHDPDQLQRLLDEWKHLSQTWKLTVTPLGGSSLDGFLPKIVMSRRPYEELKRHGWHDGEPVELRYTNEPKKFSLFAVIDVEKDSPYAPFADNMIGMEASQAARLMDRPAAGGGYRVSRLDVFLDKGTDVETVRQQIEAVVGDRAAVRTAEANRKSTEEIIGGVKLVLNLSTIGALVVGLFLVYIVLWVNVAERRHDIGVMRSLGATRGQIARLFAVEAIILGAIGSLPGIPLGVALSELAIGLFASADLTSAFLNTESSFRTELTPLTGVLAVFAGMVTALLAALIPSLQAASDEPADAVRRAPKAGGGIIWLVHRLACVFLVLAGFAVFFLRGYLPSRVGSMAGMTLILLGLFLAMPILVAFLARLLHPVCRWLFGVEARLAADNLIRAPGRTGVVIGALAAGVSLMFMTAGFGKSNEVPVREWLEQVIRADAFLFRGNMVSANSSMTPMEPATRDQLRALPGVERVVGLRFNRFEYRGTFILLLAIDAVDYKRALKARGREGSLALDLMEQLPDGNFTIVSDNFAAKWKVGVGDTVTVPGPHGHVDLKVIGIGRDYSWSQGTIFVDRKKYAELFGDTLVDAYHVFFEPDADADATYQAVQQYADREALLVQKRESVHIYLAGMLDRIFQIAYLQQLILAIVAALGVVMALLISVLQRRRELGLLRAVGATQTQVLKTVLAEAMLMGLIGTVLGFLMGLPMEWYLLRVVMQEETGFVFDVLIPWKQALGIGAISMLTATVAGLVPAFHAMRQRITEAIAYE